jgi:hypothetical protein
VIVPSDFRPAWWLPGPHLQTLWPNTLRPRPRVRLARERLELPDGDFLDLDWAPDRSGPLVLVLHGLEGSSKSGYAAGILRRLAQTGFQGVLMHARGCSGEPNRLHRAYHAGETGDLAQVIEELKTRFPGRPLAAVGYSLGGNALLKWLGETGADNPLAAAVAVSVPFVLGHAHERLQGGFSRLYQWHLMGKMKRGVRRKRDLPGYPVDVAAVQRLTTFREFDDQVTAPLHGFDGVDDYYARASSRLFLAGIQRPTLVLHARNDPFMFAHSVPTEQELSPCIRLELSEHGGHVGFVEGKIPGLARYWLERRIPQWLRETLV